MLQCPDVRLGYLLGSQNNAAPPKQAGTRRRQSLLGSSGRRTTAAGSCLLHERCSSPPTDRPRSIRLAGLSSCYNGAGLAATAAPNDCNARSSGLLGSRAATN